MPKSSTDQPSSTLLRHVGVTDVDRAQGLLAALPGSASVWCQLMTQVADPDLALLQAVRLSEVAGNEVADVVTQSGRSLERLVAVLGGSRALGDVLISHPNMMSDVWNTHPRPADVLLVAVGAKPDDLMPVAAAGKTPDDLRRAYRRLILGVAADDLTSEDPTTVMPDIARRLADLADGAMQASLALARRDIDPLGRVRLAVIAMGKTGAQELNYVSDVDVVFVVAPGEGTDEGQAGQVQDQQAHRAMVEIGTRLAVMTAQGCSGAGAEPPLWTVDATLRPEGGDGVLVRTVDSYQTYWDKWAQSWEFQALLKARCCAGDRKLGEEFCQAAQRMVWSAAGREGFVDNARAMRQRVEENIPRKEVDRELKLGPGGLRDVEFSVQLLQLVHGRSDASLRVKDTVHAIRALKDGGYIGREAGKELEDCYRFLRAVEHRTQLARMRRTHLLPSASRDVRVLARAMDPDGHVGPEGFLDRLEHVRHRVRALHEDVFYRPIVAATAQLSPDEAALDRGAAMDRLKAIGYRDPMGSLGHIQALTAGVSRRAAIQRHLLPVFMSWLANGADPDMGILGFRRLSDTIGDSHWYLTLLRDSGVAAWRLCHILPNSRWMADSLAAIPEAVEWLDSDELLAPVTKGKLIHEVHSLIRRYPDPGEAAARVANVRVREMTRAGMSDILDGVEAGKRTLSESADVALQGALTIALREEAADHGDTVDMAIVAMGRLGGEETGYASDADVMFVHRTRPGVDAAQAVAAATRVASEVRRLLSHSTTAPGLVLDVDLRPEGKAGPMTRTLESYCDYWEKWASIWERQALLRARVCAVSAGGQDLADAFEREANRVRFEHGVSAQDVTQIRLLKARMEEERLPHGVEPTRHVKLGPGGLSDVEWVVQLLQLQHGAKVPKLRTTHTLDALRAEVEVGLLSADQGEILEHAWSLAARIRSGNVLATGRSTGPKVDVVPRDVHDLKLLAHVLGYQHGHERDLVEDWLRAARQARRVMEQTFWA